MSRIFQCVSISMFIFLFAQTLVASCIQGNCKNGKGTYLFKDGSKYLGSFSDYMPTGKGIFLSQNGVSYEGEFLNGKKHGLGRLVFNDGSIYVGSFDQDVISGNGKILYSNKDQYNGMWANGKANGSGTYTFESGDVYNGEFLNGEFNGLGRLTTISGAYYEGSWSNSRKHGNGISFSNFNFFKVRYKMNSLVHSEQLIYKTEDQKQQTNEIKDCINSYCNNEIGSIVFNDGSKYKGYFIDGKPNGEGVCVYSDGKKYVGQWKDHSPNGMGSMYYPNGKKYTANWTDGKMVKIEDRPTISNVSYAKPTQSGIKDDLGPINVYALIVGVAAYNHQQSLKYTDDDAYHLYAFLKSPEGGAIVDDNIKLLIDDAATKSSIENELQNISARADANDVVLIYLSGHGLDGFFVPSDFDGYNYLLPYDNILNKLQSSQAKHKILITDACHSGSMIAQARDMKTISVAPFYEAYGTTKGGIAIITSSKKEEVSLEYGGLRQGIFSHFLIRGLKGEANSNNDKLITVSELFDYVSKQVKSYTAGVQHPTIQGSFDGEMPLAMIR